MGYEIVILSMELINQNHCKWSVNRYADQLIQSRERENLIKIQLEIIITFGRSIVLIAQKKWVIHEFEARFPGKVSFNYTSK